MNRTSLCARLSGTGKAIHRCVRRGHDPSHQSVGEGHEQTPGYSPGSEEPLPDQYPSALRAPEQGILGLGQHSSPFDRWQLDMAAPATPRF